MFRPAAIFLALRYTRAKRGNHFISFISLMSIIGIALGVTVLITTLSVINGFDREIKKSIFSIMTPITVSSFSGQVKNWKAVEKITKAEPGITAVAPFVSGEALLQNSDHTQPITIIGILPAAEKGITTLSDKMITGNLADLKAKQYGIVLGEDSARRLGVKKGDQIVVLTTKKSSSVSNIKPVLNRFTITGIFHAGSGALNYDGHLAFIHLNDAQKIFDLGSAVTALHANVDDIYAATHISLDLQRRLSFQLINVTNWTDQLGDYFENIKLTKTIMFFIFILIIVVAIFNLIGTLVMLVNNKRSDIAILRTIGATPAMIMAIFVVQGVIIGSIGTMLGVTGGILLAENITSVVDFIQYLFHIQLISSNVYFVDYLPSELQWHDVWRISVAALALSLLATLRPAWTAARTQPAEALRYD